MENRLAITTEAPPISKATKPAIKTHGFELFLIGIAAFVVIITFTILIYKIFIVERVKHSREYITANHFVVNARTYDEGLKDLVGLIEHELMSPIEAVSFDEMNVQEKDDYGLSQVIFSLTLKNGLTERVAVTLAKIADFWLVAEVILYPDHPLQTYLPSTYARILQLLQLLDFKDYQGASSVLELIKKECRDPNLVYYLDARVNTVGGNFTHARQRLDDLLISVNYSKLAVMFEQGVVNFEQRSDPASPDAIDKAITTFLAIEKTYEEFYAKLKPSEVKNIFSSIPKDQLIASLDAESILASSRQWLSASYRLAGKHDQALSWAEKAIEQAGKINSPVLRRESTFEKGKNLYYLGRYLDAEKAFDEVAYDIDNTNLVQKSWAFYFKGDIAARDSRHAKALDYFERAITLDPASAIVRQAAIQYLINRHFVGDIEIALGLALRGIDSEAGQGTTFKDLAARLYQMLGMKDKTQHMQ